MTVQIWKQFMGGSQDERPKAYRLASPLEHLDERRSASVSS